MEGVQWLLAAIMWALLLLTFIPPEAQKKFHRPMLWGPSLNGAKTKTRNGYRGNKKAMTPRK